MKTMTLLHRAAAAGLLAACALVAAAQSASPWRGYDSISLHLSDPARGSSWSQSYRIELDGARGDMAIEMDLRAGEERAKGTLALVGNRVLLARGLPLRPGFEIDALDEPVLQMQLTMRVLGEVVPEGPQALKGQLRIDRGGKQPLELATRSAAMRIEAPWRVVGQATRLPTGAVAFNWVLTAPAPRGAKKGDTFRVRMQGEVAPLGRPPFSDTDSLEGWSSYVLGPRAEAQGGATKLDFGATPRPDTSFRTIKDIRAFIAAENHPGTRDDKRDFSGIWRTKCEHDHGLRIRRDGPQGMYSIVFCGPGGCGEKRAEHTHITGDKRWEVVSDDEIARRDAPLRYRRCPPEAK